MRDRRRWATGPRIGSSTSPANPAAAACVLPAWRRCSASCQRRSAWGVDIGGPAPDFHYNYGLVGHRPFSCPGPHYPESVMIFETLDTFGHEQVVFCHNKDAGLQAIIALHNTVLGPALGGTRMWPYKSEEEALNDVLRLWRGMTYKNAVAGLDIGGGKAVIIGDPATDKSEALFRAFGQFVESLGGRYITAEDVGIDVNDMEYVFKE